MHLSFLSRKVLYISGAFSSGHLVRDHERRVDLAGLDLLQQRPGVALHVGLAHLEGQALVHRARRTGACPGSRRRRRGPTRVPPLRQHMIASRSTCARSVASPTAAFALSITASTLPPACASAPTASMQLSGPLPLVISIKRVVDVLLLEVDRLGLALPGHLEALGHGVDGDHPPGAEHPGAADRELGDRAAAPDGDRVARLDLGVLRGHVAGGEDVGQEDDLLIGQVVGDHLTGPTSA